MEKKKYLKWDNKVGYGSGDIAGNVVYAFLSSFVMIYLTNTVGLNAGIVGTLIAGWLLEFGGFNGAVEMQSASCINMLYFMYLWIPVIINLCITLILSRMKVEKANEEIRARQNL